MHRGKQRHTQKTQREDTQANTQTDTHVDLRTDRAAQTGKHTDICAYRHMDRPICTQTYKQIHRKDTDKQKALGL